MNTEQLIELTQTLFDNAKDIPAASVGFSEEVRTLCEQNMCGNFGKSWTCPPAVDSLEILQAKVAPYTRFTIFNKVFPLEDSFDWEGMVNSVKAFQRGIGKLKKGLRNADPGFDCLILGAGACTLCPTCSYTLNEPCKNPDNAVYSVEAFGIDAMALMTDNGLQYNNGPNTVTYVGGVFHDRT